MLADGQPQRMSDVAFLLSSGGLPLLALGLGLAIVGIVLAVRPTHRNIVFAYAGLSMLPGLLAIAMVYGACVDFTSMAANPRPPKPVEFARVSGYAMSCSILGIVGTLLPMSIANVAFFRAHRPIRLEPFND